MNLKITSTEKEGYLLIKVTGDVVTDEDLLTHSHLLYTEAKKYNHTNLLLEQTGAHFPKKIFSYLELVKHYQVDFPDDITGLKVASVVLPEYKELGNFWETASINRGFQFYIFTSVEEAENFLLK